MFAMSITIVIFCEYTILLRKKLYFCTGFVPYVFFRVMWMKKGIG